MLHQLLQGAEGGAPRNKEPALVQLADAVVLHRVPIADREGEVIPPRLRVPGTKGAVNRRLPNGQKTANRRSPNGQHTVNIRPTYGQQTDNIRTTYGQHTVNIRSTNGQQIFLFTIALLLKNDGIERTVPTLPWFDANKGYLKYIFQLTNVLLSFFRYRYRTDIWILISSGSRRPSYTNPKHWRCVP